MAKDYSVDTEHARIIEHVLVGSAFRAAVGSLEIQGRGFFDAVRPIGRGVAQRLFFQAHSFEIAIHFIARRVEDRRLELPLAHALQHVDASKDVRFEIAPGIIDGSRHGNLAGEVKYRSRLDAFDDPVYLGGVARIAVYEFHASGTEQPLQIVGRSVPAEVIEEHYAPAILAQSRGDIAADKATTAGYQRGIAHGKARIFTAQ